MISGVIKNKYEQSIKNYINKEGAYTIKFEGETTDNVISGKFSGTLLSHSYTGTWSANGESNAFSASVKGSENDPLGFSNKFVEGTQQGYFVQRELRQPLYLLQG